LSLSISLLPLSSKSREPFQSWVKRWRKQKDTVTIDSSGKKTCDTTTDQNNPASEQTFLYQRNYTDATGKGIPICTGFKFEDFAEDGSDIDTIAPYAYDAVIALATGIGLALKENKFIDARNNSGDVIGGVMADSSFLATGITGEIAFSMGDETGYGYGDRERGNAHFC